jgi:phosphoribosylformimino-5-aminoimidazole carboxamide ribotide isomerase
LHLKYRPAKGVGMEIVPVIDLKDGLVVHARMGQRELYRPIQTPLARSSLPVDVVGGIISIFPFATLYIADLDAIEGFGDNRASIVDLKEAFPQVRFWVDSGIADPDTAAKWLPLGMDLILGSETQTGISTVSHFSGDPRFVLSLDFREDAFQGPSTLLMHADCWPARVIVMTLDRVGTQSGPDLERLRAVKAIAKDRAIYAAGGVRGADDLQSLVNAGITGALVASSLHNGQITAVDIHALQNAPRQRATVGSPLP